MHSLKNTFVAVVLLGVSYFVYQGITNPAVPIDEGQAGMGLDLEIPETDLSNTLGDGGPASAPNSMDRLGLSPNPGQRTQNRSQPQAPPLMASPNRGNAISQQPSHFDSAQGSGSRTSSDFQPRNTQPPAGSQPKSFDVNGSFARNLNGTSPPRQASKFETQTPMNPVNPQSFQPQPNRNAPPATEGQFAAPRKNVIVKPREEFASTADIEMAWPKVNQFVDEGNFRRALGTLTRFYESDNLSPTQHGKMLEWLDALAGKVIYSSEHNLFPNAYVIQPNDTMQSLANQWSVPAQLIYNVNQSKISNPLTLTPGNELKVIKGPFNANLQLSEQTLTLFLDNMYAGRFKTQASATIRPGEYRVSTKVASGGPLGRFQVELVNRATGETCSLHSAEGNAGSIGLSSNDAEDLFGILSVGSSVNIK